jgi:hypothetical protein
MFERLVIALLTNLGSWLLTKGLIFIQKREEKCADDASIDLRVDKVKESLREALDGTPVTPEQRSKFNNSLRDLIRGADAPRMSDPPKK